MKLGLSGVVAALTLLVPSAVLANIFALKVENDAFPGGYDDHYTNGVEGSWGFEPLPDHWTRRVAEVVPGWVADDVTHAAYRAGHQMFTPEDITISALQVDDRPYAALMYGGISLLSADQLPTHRETSILTLDVGLVGQGAGGEKIQRGVHELTNSDIPEGWDHQLENEPFVNIGLEKRWWIQDQLGGLEMDFGPNAGGALGNLYTYLSSGAGIRVGQGLSRAVSHVPGASGLSGPSFFEAGSGFDWYAYANLEGRYVAHNMLLDGNTFKDSHSVDRKAVVGDAQIGLVLMWDRWQLTFSNVWRSREFHGQDKPDQFGSISLATSL
ncbi:MAG TPA: lipid A deacylase LpxR family protein [Pseudomonas sp.]|nr:lipid A deacylase LpxR family protein [Pseudomonas sp.]